MKIVLDTVRWFGYERVFSTIGLGKMSNADEASAGELLWQSARENYEDPAQGLAAIAARLGVSKYKLVTEARRRGWTLRGTGRASNTSTRATIQRFKELLQNRLAQLEGQLKVVGEEASATNSERDIRSANTLVRTLEKVLELERKDRSLRARKIRERRQLDDAVREEFARRIASLRRGDDGSISEPHHVPLAAAGNDQGLAQLGKG